MKPARNENSLLAPIKTEEEHGHNTSFSYSFIRACGKSQFVGPEDIRNKMKILQDHMLNCERERKFVEAAIAKQKIEHLKKIEKENVVEEIKHEFEKYNQILELEQKLELDKLNDQHDTKFVYFKNKFENYEKELESEYEKKIEICKEQLNQTFTAKPSGELLNLNKMLESSIKIKKYDEAHFAQVKIKKLSQNEKVKKDMFKEQKLKQELLKLKSKFEQDSSTLHLKMTQAFNELKKKRAIDFDTLIQKHKNKLKDLEITYKNDLADFNRLKTSSKVLGTDGSIIISSKLN